MKITGTATIRIDGRELRSLQGAVLNPGGIIRVAQKGHKGVHGYSEELVEPTMECKIVDTRDLSILRLNAVTDATVLFETDTGKRYLLAPAWTSEPCALNSGAGEVDLKMAAKTCKELGVG